MRPLRRHVPFYLACAAGAGALVAGLLWFPARAVLLGANAFFLSYLVLVLLSLPRLTPDRLERHAARDDVPVAIIFLITLGAIVTAIVSLFLLLNSGKPGAPDLVFAFASLPLGWLTVHVMAALHYAHEFWQPDGRDRSAGRAGGLEFPQTERPGGVDFLYFALVIGMTAQTSDVQITSTAMRGTNILHAVVSFFFNTVLVAAAVNAAVTLGN